MECYFAAPKSLTPRSQNSSGPRLEANEIIKISKFYDKIYTKWKYQYRGTSMQKLENKHIRLIYFLNGWIWWIIRGPVPRWQLVRTPVKLLGRLARTCARSGGDGRWQLSLKESVNNIRGWLRDALSKSNLSVDHNKKHRANSINHSSTFAYFFSVCQFILYFIYIDNLSYRYHINYTISLTAT